MKISDCNKLGIITRSTLTSLPLSCSIRQFPPVSLLSNKTPFALPLYLVPIISRGICVLGQVLQDPVHISASLFDPEFSFLSRGVTVQINVTDPCQRVASLV